MGGLFGTWSSNVESDVWCPFAPNGDAEIVQNVKDCGRWTSRTLARDLASLE